MDLLLGERRLEDAEARAYAAEAARGGDVGEARRNLAASMEGAGEAEAEVHGALRGARVGEVVVGAPPRPPRGELLAPRRARGARGRGDLAPGRARARGRRPARHNVVRVGGVRGVRHGLRP